MALNALLGSPEVLADVQNCCLTERRHHVRQRHPARSSKSSEMPASIYLSRSRALCAARFINALLPNRRAEAVTL